MVKYNVRAASTPVVINGWATVGGIFDNGLCPRVCYLRAVDIEAPVDDKSRGYFAKGIAHEQIYLDRFPEGTFDYQFDAVEQLSENISWGGHPDLIDKVTGEVIELKSVHSPNSYKFKFKKGYTGADWTHVSQIGKYMQYMLAPKGKVVYTSYAEGHEGEEREIVIEFDGTNIIGGGHVIPVSGFDEGKQAMVEQLETHTLFADLPIVVGSLNSPCDRCPLKTHCFNRIGRIDGKELQEYAKSLGWGAREK